MKLSNVALLVTSLVAIALAKPLGKNANELLDSNVMTNGLEAQGGPAKEQGDFNKLIALSF